MDDNTLKINLDKLGNIVKKEWIPKPIELIGKDNPVEGILSSFLGAFYSGKTLDFFTHCVAFSRDQLESQNSEDDFDSNFLKENGISSEDEEL